MKQVSFEPGMTECLSYECGDELRVMNDETDSHVLLVKVRPVRQK